MPTFPLPIIGFGRRNSRLSRNELYSYGFKEGQPQGQDRRVLESALRGMSELERDIHENYSHLHASYGPALHGPYDNPRGHRPPSQHRYNEQYAPRHRGIAPDVRITRSTDGESNLYHRGPHSSPGYTHELHPPDRYQPPPPSVFATAGYRGFPSCSEIEDSPPLPRRQSELPSYSSYRQMPIPQQGQQPHDPSQMQMVRYGGPANQRQHSTNSGYSESDEEGQYIRQGPSAGISHGMSPNWSTTTNIAPSSSTASDIHLDAGYPRFGGYVANMGSYGGHREALGGFDEDEEEFMSDGVASDEEDYYSSDGGVGFADDDGSEVYSDEGYDSPAGGYDGYE